MKCLIRKKGINFVQLWMWLCKVELEREDDATNIPLVMVDERLVRTICYDHGKIWIGDPDEEDCPEDEFTT